MSLTGYIRRVVETINGGGVYEEPDPELIANFAASESATALYIVQTRDDDADHAIFRLHASFNTFPHNLLAIVAVIKLAGPLDQQCPEQQLSIVDIPAGPEVSSYETLRAVIRSVVGPVFEAAATKSTQKSSNYVAARQKLAELELSLVNLQHHQEVQFVELDFPSAPTTQEVDTATLNSLQNMVNGWKRTAQSVASTDRDVGASTASEEVHFWHSMELALTHLQTQLESDDARAILQVLERGKRFHATVNFLSDTGLPDALEKVHKYNMLLQELPLNDLLTAPSLAAAGQALDAIFGHLSKRLRASGYPVSRSLSLVEAISSDLASTLRQLAGPLLSLPSLEFAARTASLRAVFTKWDDHLRDFTTLARDIIRKRAEKFIPVRIKPRHSMLQERIEYIATFRQRYAELAQTLEQIAANDRELRALGLVGKLSAAYSKLAAIDVLETSAEGAAEWAAGEREYDAAAARAENDVAEVLRARLAASASSQDMFGIFDQFNALFGRPAVRGAIQEYQALLLERVKSDLTELQRRSSRREALDAAVAGGKLRDVPPLSGLVSWMAQVAARLDTLLNRVSSVLGTEWRHYADGERLYAECEAFRAQFDPKRVVSEWVAALTHLQVAGAVLVVKRGKLTVSLNRQLWGLHREVKMLRTLRLAVPHHVLALAGDVQIVYPMAVRLNEAVQTFYTVNSMQPPARLALATPFNAVYALFQQIMGLQWQDFLGIDDRSGALVAQLDRAVLHLQSSAQQAHKTHATILNLLGDLETCEYSQTAFADILAAVSKNIDAMPSSYSKAVDEMVAKVLGARCRAQLSEFSTSLPQTPHRITVLDQVISVEPSLEETMTKWYAQIAEIVSVAKADEVVAVGAATSEIVSSYRDASAYVGQWFEFQALWDLKPETVFAALKTLPEWLQALEEVRSARAELERGGGERRFGAFVVSFGHVYWLISSKYDMWQNSLLRKFGELVASAAVEFSASLAAPRAALETLNINDAHPAAIVETLDTLAATELALSDSQADQLAVLKRAQAVLARHRFKFPPNWLYVDQLAGEWDALASVLETRRHEFELARDLLQTAIQHEAQRLQRHVTEILAHWASGKPVSGSIKPEDALFALSKFDSEVKRHSHTRQLLVRACAAFEVPLDAPDLSDAAREIADIATVWRAIDAAWTELHGLEEAAWTGVTSRGLRQTLKTLVEQTQEMPVRVRQYAAFQHLQTVLRQRVETSDLVQRLRSVAMQSRHWRELSMSPPASLGDVWALDLFMNRAQIEAVLENAEGEARLAEYLSEVGEFWTSFTLELVPFREVQLIRNWSDIFAHIDEHLQSLATMHHSPYFAAHSAACSEWELRLAGLRALFDPWVEVQREWVYLEGVFGAPELRQVLPTETAKFNAVNAELSAILRLASRSPRVLDVAAIPGISESITRLAEQLHKLQRALGEYFERERQRFPRFYFVGDDDLLEMIASTDNCERHLAKMFAGVASFEQDNNKICGVKSPQGEVLYFGAPAHGESAVELLRDVEVKTVEALKSATRKACDSLNWSDLGTWLTEHPGQAALLAMQLSPPPDYDAVLTQLASLAAQSQSMSLLERRKLEAAITLLVHLQQSRRQLCYKWVDDGIVIKFGGAEFSYGFEYHGVPDALVRTELGDELFLTLTQALAQRQGGAPFGPAGTGKTESVKALGQALGKHVLVFCCDETFDVRAVSRLLLGICQVGAWGCFDEFNRLGMKDLSAVSSQVAEIETALATQREFIELGGRRGRLSGQTGLFVTMNPNYAGRNALPENLRKQFRSFALTHPDKQRIAQVMLYAHGFKDAQRLAAAIVPLFDKISTSVSTQRHYDWGLRALKNVLRICGALRADGTDEIATVRRACAETIEPKLVDADLEIYRELEQASFGGTAPQLRAIDIKDACEALDLTATPSLALKVTQLQRFLQLHTGVILVGEPAAGKSASLSCLARIAKAELYVVDAKVMSKSELYGRLDPVTREWTDGLFTHLLRRIKENLRGEDRTQHWVVFDGDVDPEWAENLNSVLDDNRLLTLPSGERLQLPDNFRILFEVSDLSAATPATVSRCGIIWYPNNRVNEDAVLEEAATRAAKFDHIMDFSVPQAYKTYTALCRAAAARSDSPEFNAKSRVHALTWAFAGQATAEQRAELAKWAAARLGVEVPPGDVMDFDVSPFSGQWMPWQDSVDEVDLEPRAIVEPNLVIPTIDTVRLEQLLLRLVTAHQPVVLCGPPGSGKTMTLLSSLRGSESMDVVPLNFSKTTHASQIVRTLEQHCMYTPTPEGLVLEPAGIGRWVVLFCDEINLVARDKFGTQAPIALLRQLAEHGGFWHRRQWVSLRRIQFVGACNPPTDAGRSPLSPRFLRHATVLRVGYPSAQSLRQIYGALGAALLKCTPDLRGSTASLADAMIQVYEACAASPFASKYVYSPRELTRWTRGIYEAVKDQYSLQLEGLARIWAHEALRVFSDRLRTREQRNWTAKTVNKAAFTHFGIEIAHPMLYTRWLTREYGECDRKSLTKFLQARMMVFAEEVVDMPLTLFDDLVDHALRIDRVLSQRQGHIILMGPSASGKTTLVRFVCWMNGMATHMLKTFNGFSDADFAAELRSVLRRAVTSPVALILDEAQVSEPAFVEKMNTLLANGEVPGLFEGDELAALVAACRSAGAVGDDEDVLRWFTNTITANLHVVFTLAPASQLVASPALANRCILNYMGDWSADSLAQVAQARTALLDVPQDVTPLVMVEFHERAKRRSVVFPGDYIAFVSQFCAVYTTKRSEMEDEQRHFNVGIDRLKGTMLEVRQLKTKLAAKQTELATKQQRAKQMLQQMLAEQSEAERKREASIEIKAAVEAQNEQIKERQTRVYADLDLAEPAVRDAQRGVSNIKKQHLNELRAFTNPPEAVKITLEAVCVLLGRTPGSWREVLQQVRGDDFIANIVQFDNERQLTPLVLRQLQRYLDLPNFNYEAVNRASKACGPLLQWVLAQVAYATVLQQVEPLRRQVAELEHAAREKHAQQQAINQMIDELERSIENYQTDYATLIAETQAVKQDMNSVDSKISRSVELIASLESEKQRWADSVREFGSARSRLFGDCLVAAAFLAYAGSLDQRQRLELVDEWLLVCEAHSIGFTEQLDLATYFGATADDALTAANVAILSQASRYAYVIDPTGERALSIMRKQRPDLVVTSFEDAAFAKHVESALRFGTTVVVTAAERFDPLLMPVVNKEYTRRGGRTVVEFGRAEIDVSAKFRLVMLTSDPAASPPAHLAARTAVVNFSVTRNSLELIALDRALATHRPELEANRRELARVQTEYKLELHSLEVELLAALNDSGTEILENQPVMDTLERVKRQAVHVSHQVAQADEAMAGLATAAAEFEPVAVHSGRIFALLDGLQEVNFFYQFSLDSFFESFAKVSATPETLSALYREIYRAVAPALRQADRPAFAAALLALYSDEDLSLEDVYERAVKTWGSVDRTSADVAWLDAIMSAGTRPILFGMAGADPTLQIRQLAEKSHLKCVVLGLGSLPTASAVETALQHAAKMGHWLVLQNIHLDSDAMALVSSRQATVDPGFRLILTADITAPNLPVPLLRLSRLLCVERPDSVTVAVSEAMAFIGPERLAALPAERAKVYLAIAWLHAVVVERWADLYPYSDADLQSALWTVDQWMPASSRSNIDPASLNWDELRDLVYTAVYGAKMDSAQDRADLRNILDQLVSVKLFDVGYKFCGEVQVPEFASQIPEWLAALPRAHRPSWLGLDDSTQSVREKNTAAATANTAESLAKHI